MPCEVLTPEHLQGSIWLFSDGCYLAVLCLLRSCRALPIVGFLSRACGNEDPSISLHYKSLNNALSEFFCLIPGLTRLPVQSSVQRIPSIGSLRIGNR